MAETYVAATRIKTGAKEDESFIEHGERVTKRSVGEETFEELLATKAIVTEEEYDLLFPEQGEGENQAYGTPSNLEQVEGTELQMNRAPDDDSSTTTAPAVNPANPPEVEGARTPDGNREDEDEDETTS